MSTAMPLTPPPASPSPDAVPLRDELVAIPVIEESAVIEKRSVDQGGWRITKRVDLHEQVVEQALRSEQVQVVRRPVGELLVGMVAPAPRQEGDTWILPVVEEVLVTEKRLLLKEEIRITRTESTRPHAERFSLRSEEVSIERLEPGAAPGIVSP